MLTELDRITNEALSLPSSSRAVLAEKLLESLDEADEIAALWADEAERRCREIDAGQVHLYPGDDVLAEARSRARTR